MSAGERSPQIPLSPSSPPDTGLKRRRHSDKSATLPLSPPLMSVATKSYVSPYGNSQHSDEMATRSSPRSPAQSSTFTQATSQRNQQYSTPNSSTHSIPGLTMMEDTDSHRDKRQKLASQEEDNQEQIPSQNSLLATNHDRQDEMTLDDTQMKSNGQNQGGNNAFEEVQNDMGEMFLLGKSRIERQKPNPQKHLLSIYGLGSLLKSVARTHPLTGEKINKLRKSYEGQIKSFGLAGRNKPVKGERDVEEEQPGPLRRMAGILPEGIIPEEQWQAEHGQSRIEITTEMRAKFRQAVQLQPGTVRNNAHWEDVLGHEKPRSNIAQPSPTGPPGPQRIFNGTVRPQNAMSAEAKRQTRGKKRSYGDESFVGYGEGYSDPEDGYAEGEGDEDGMTKRKRKKESMSAPLTYGQYMLGR